MKQVVLTFKPDGSVEVKAIGFQGKGCLEATKPYEAALGIEGEHVPTIEMYQAPKQDHEQRSE